MFDTREKRERSLGTKLFLKAYRCNSPKCALVRSAARPGVHGKARRRSLSEFGQQVQEKQKIKFTYGIRENQLRKIFDSAARHVGATGELIVSLLERRLDNALYRLGIAPSRSVARQLISHGHMLVNGRKVTISSYQVRPGDVIAIRPQSRTHPVFAAAAEAVKKIEPPVWLHLDPERLEGKVIALPKDFEIPFDVNMIVDYYSK